MNDKGFEVIKGGNDEPVGLPIADKSAVVITGKGEIDRHPNHPSRKSIPINPSTRGLKVVPNSLLKRQAESEDEKAQIPHNIATYLLIPNR